MSIDSGIFFAVVFLIVGLGLLYQAVNLKWKEKFWQVEEFDNKDSYNPYNFSKETMNTIGSISLIISAGFLISAVIVFFKWDMFQKLLQGNFILAFITIFAGILYISSKDGWRR